MLGYGGQIVYQSTRTAIILEDRYLTLHVTDDTLDKDSQTEEFPNPKATRIIAPLNWTDMELSSRKIN